MRCRSPLPAGTVVAAGAVLSAAMVLHGEPPAASPDDVNGEARPIERVGVAEARRQTRLLSETYEATLLIIHRRYFDRDDKELIPARALEEVFRSTDEGSGRATRWVAVNTPPMNVDHAARAGFEQRAAEELAAGAESFEAVEEGVYRRAIPVALTASCLRCHEPGLTKQITKRRVAAVVFEIPVETRE